MATAVYNSDTGEVEVTLSPEEVSAARAIAAERHASQRKAGRFDWKAKPDADGPLNDFQGLLGEVAVMHAFGYSPKDHVSVLSIEEWLRSRDGITDVAGMEVRSVARERNDHKSTSLIVKHDKDSGKDDVPFVLVRLTESGVVGQYDRTVRIVGWTYGRNAFAKDGNGDYVYWRGDEGVDRANIFFPACKPQKIASLFRARSVPLPKDKYSDLYFGV